VSYQARGQQMRRMMNAHVLSQQQAFLCLAAQHTHKVSVTTCHLYPYLHMKMPCKLAAHFQLRKEKTKRQSVAANSTKTKPYAN